MKKFDMESSKGNVVMLSEAKHLVEILRPDESGVRMTTVNDFLPDMR